jgi:hypothetical protein
MLERGAGNSDAIAEAIENYLRVRPQAADTVEGIARWWLCGDLHHASLELIQHAVDGLCRRGVLQATLRSGQMIYQAATASGGNGSSGH